MTATEILEINPPEANNLLAKGTHARLIDVRSKVEFDYVGHPLGAIHVPWKEFPEWTENPGFVNDVEKALRAENLTTKEHPLLIICRSGVRSMSAARVLVEHGFTRVYNVSEGFEGDKDDDQHRGNLNGWRFHGLPWEQG